MGVDDKDLEFLKNFENYQSEVPLGLWNDVANQLSSQSKEDPALQGLQQHRSAVPADAWKWVKRGLLWLKWRKWAFGLSATALVVTGAVLFLPFHHEEKTAVNQAVVAKKSSALPENKIQANQTNTIRAPYPVQQNSGVYMANHTTSTTNPNHHSSLPATQDLTSNSAAGQSDGGGNKEVGKPDLQEVEVATATTGVSGSMMPLHNFRYSFPSQLSPPENLTAPKPEFENNKNTKLQVYAGSAACLNIPQFGYNLKWAKFYWPTLQDALKMLAENTNSFSYTVGVQRQINRNLFAVGFVYDKTRLKVYGDFTTNEFPQFNNAGEIEKIIETPIWITYKIDALVQAESFALPVQYYREIGKKTTKLFVGGGLTPSLINKSQGSFIVGGNPKETVDGKGIVKKLNMDASLGLMVQQPLTKNLVLQYNANVSRTMLNVFASSYKQSASVYFWKPSLSFKLAYSL